LKLFNFNLFTISHLVKNFVVESRNTANNFFAQSREAHGKHVFFCREPCCFREFSPWLTAKRYFAVCPQKKQKAELTTNFDFPVVDT
jgi:hypothetical protein